MPRAPRWSWPLHRECRSTSRSWRVGRGISVGFLENIIGDLRRSGLVMSRRGRHGGYLLARPPSEVTIADVMRAEIGNLADIHGQRPEDAEYPGRPCI